MAVGDGGEDLIRDVLWNMDEGRFRAPWRLGAQSLLGFVLVLILVGVFFAAFGLEVTDELPRYMLDRVLAFTVVAQGLGLLVSVVVAARYIDERSLSGLGLHLDRNWFLDFVFGFILAFSMVSVVFALHLVSGSLEVVGFVSIDEAVSISVGFPIGFIGVFVLMVFVGFYEELLVRGYYLKNMAEGLNGFSGLDERAGLAVAAGLSSLAFGLLHGLNSSSSLFGVVNISLIGLLLALMVYVSGEIGYCTGFHVAWNVSMGLIYGYSVSGFETGVSLVETSVVGSGFITGGGFGPEASIAVSFSVVIGFVGFYLWHRWGNDGFRVDIGYSRYEEPS